MTDTGDRQLLESLSALPREIRPRPGVWPRIESRLDDEASLVRPAEAGSRRWPMALAAGFALALAVGLFTGRQWIPAPDGPTAVAESPWSSDVAGGLAMAEVEYQAALREFMASGPGADALHASGAEVIHRDWSELRALEAEVAAALSERPDDPFLNQTMHRLRSQQLGFLKSLALTESNSRSI